MKFATKLTSLLLSLFLVMAASVSYTVYVTNRKSIEHQVKTNFESLAERTMEMIDRTLFERFADIQIIASDPVIRSRNSLPREITQRLLDFRNTYKTYVSLSFFDLNRIRIADTAGMNLGSQHHEVWWSRDAIDNGIVSAAADIRIAEDLLTACIYFACPVNDEKGEAFGVVVSRMPVDKLYDITREVLSGYEEMNIELDLIDKNGLLLYSSHNRKGILKEKYHEWGDTADWKLKQSMTGRKTGSMRHFHTIGGEEKFDIFTREQWYLDFKGNDWTLIFHIPAQKAFAPERELRNRVLIILFAVTLLSILIAVLFSRGVSRPLIRLRNAALDIGKGNLKMEVRVESKDEIGELTSSFKKMCEDLQKSREDLLLSKGYTENIIASMMDALVIVTPEGVIRMVNRATCNLLGYEEKELIGKHIGAIFEGELEGIGPYDLIIKRGFINNVEKTYRAKDGRKIPVLFSGSVMHDDNGKIQGIVCVALDITERKRDEDRLRQLNNELERAEEAYLNIMDDLSRQKTGLQKSRESLSKAQEIAHLGNWEWDVIRNEMYWSSEIYRIFGYLPKEFVATYEDSIKHVHPDDKERVKRAKYEAIFEKKPYSLDYRILLSDGTEKIVHSEGNVNYNGSGDPLRIFGTIQDITERKKIEDALRKAKEEAEEATKLKDKFVSLVSHDLKGPLGTIIGFIKLVRESAAENEKMLLDTALNSGQNMLSLIDDILSMSRIRAGIIKPKYVFMDAYYVAIEAVMRLEHLAENKGVEIINKIPEKTRIYADYSLLNEVIKNLVSNAIKFCKKGDIITLFIPKGEPSTIAVADTGMGIKPEILADLFDPSKKPPRRALQEREGQASACLYHTTLWRRTAARSMWNRPSAMEASFTPVSP